MLKARAASINSIIATIGTTAVTIATQIAANALARRDGSLIVGLRDRMRFATILAMA